MPPHVTTSVQLYFLLDSLCLGGDFRIPTHIWSSGFELSSTPVEAQRCLSCSGIVRMWPQATVSAPPRNLVEMLILARQPRTAVPESLGKEGPASCISVNHPSDSDIQAANDLFFSCAHPPGRPRSGQPPK